MARGAVRSRGRPRNVARPAAGNVPAARAASPAGYEAMRRLALVASLAFDAVGVLLAVDGAGVLGGWDDALLARFFPNGPTPEALALREFLYAPLGAAGACRWLLTAWLFHEPLRRRERWAARAVGWSLLLGFVLEAGAAGYRRAWFALWYAGLWPVVLVGLPLWRMRTGLRAPAR